MSLIRRPRGFALWLALLAVFARGLLPGGVMLAHDGSGGYGLTVALCSGGQVRIHTIADAATPTTQTGECVYALAALPALPPALPLDIAGTDRATEAPRPLPPRVAEASRPAPPPARGPPLIS